MAEFKSHLSHFRGSDNTIATIQTQEPAQTAYPILRKGGSISAAVHLDDLTVDPTAIRALSYLFWTILHVETNSRLMPNQPAPETELLRAAYAAFNARDIDAALALMTPDVEWPRAFKGGFVHGPEEIRAYWTEQWGEVNPHVEPVAFHQEHAGQILVEVHQVVRDLAGAVLADKPVGHRFTVENGLIRRMEVSSLPSSGH